MAASCMRSRAKQRGAVLITGLIILGVLLLLGASAVTMSNTQFKLAGNLQFHNLALSDAESAVAAAESWLNINFADPGFSSVGQPGLYPAGTAIDPFTMKWDDTTSVKVDPDGNQRYAIELYMPGRTLPTSSVAQCNTYGTVAPCPKVNLYRISARGASRLGATKIVQSLYAVRTGK
jgi:Tfp pilus assembly protein PilX